MSRKQSFRPTAWDPIKHNRHAAQVKVFKRFNMVLRKVRNTFDKTAREMTAFGNAARDLWKASQ